MARFGFSDSGRANLINKVTKEMVGMDEYTTQDPAKDKENAENIADVITPAVLTKWMNRVAVLSGICLLGIILLIFKPAANTGLLEAFVAIGSGAVGALTGLIASKT